MRRTTTLTALLLGATLLAPTGSATAAGETCRGEAATIVGTGPAIVGTDGRDVIVAGPSVDIAAGAGDDVICVSSPVGSQQILSNYVDLDAGAGNDVVDSTAMGANFYLVASLGDGSDTFIGGVASERVAAGPAGPIWVNVPSESERDVIDTGDGSDSVASGGPGLPNDDAVRLGAGDDTASWSGVMGAQGILDGGDGDDLLMPIASGQNFGVDLAAQKLGRNGVVVGGFTSFDRLRIVPGPDLGMVEIKGTEFDDDVVIDATASLRVDLGAGDDSLSLSGMKDLNRIDLGAGIDKVAVRHTGGSVDLDLTHHTLDLDNAVGSILYGAEDVFVSANRATVVGDHRANNLGVVGCFATIEGGKGKDTIRHGNYDAEVDSGYGCTSGRTTLRGGSGNDTIQGGFRTDRIYGDGGNDTISTGPARSGANKVWGGAGNDKIQGGGDKDVLAGGAGRDTISGSRGRDVAIGGPDRDRCNAEVERSCER